jgi:hypothetical protein
MRPGRMPSGRLIRVAAAALAAQLCGAAQLRASESLVEAGRPGWGTAYGPNLDGKPAYNYQEAADSWLTGGTIRDVLFSNMADGAGVARQFVGDTCEKVCARCIFNALLDQKKGTPGAACGCHADCLQGVNRDECGKGISRSWSNNHKTVPVETWQATCGHGDRQCAEDCLGKDFLKAIQNCSNSISDVVCLRDVRDDYMPMVNSKVDGVVYCNNPRDNIKGCESFSTVPNGKRKGTWECYKSQQSCIESMIEPLARAESDVSVWKAIKPEHYKVEPK